MGTKGRGWPHCESRCTFNSFHISTSVLLVVRRICESTYRTPRNVFNKIARTSFPASARRICRFLRTSVKVPCLGRCTGRVLERRRRSKSSRALVRIAGDHPDHRRMMPNVPFVSRRWIFQTSISSHVSVDTRYTSLRNLYEPRGLTSSLDLPLLLASH